MHSDRFRTTPAGIGFHLGGTVYCLVSPRHGGADDGRTLIRPGFGEPLELYSLKTDSGEKANIAEKHPDIVTEVEDQLRTPAQNRIAGQSRGLALAGKKTKARAKQRS